MTIRMIDEYYTCPGCGFTYTIFRSLARKREKGHLKKLFCPFCNQDYNFIKAEMNFRKEVNQNEFIKKLAVC